MVTGDVLQLAVPLRGADLLPGPGLAAQGFLGRNPSHVHPQGNEHQGPFVNRDLTALYCAFLTSGHSKRFRILAHLNIHAHMHTPTAVSTTQADSQLVRSS